MIKALLFDWGDTIMRDFPDKSGPMASWDKVEWIPFLEDVLKNGISQKFLCVVASNSGDSDTELMIKALDRIHATEYFYDFYTSHDFGVEKPDKRFFETILHLLKINPDEAIMIGNNYHKDIEGAKSAKIPTIFFNETEHKKDEFPAADIVISSMEVLPLAIKRIEERYFNL